MTEKELINAICDKSNKYAVMTGLHTANVAYVPSKWKPLYLSEAWQIINGNHVLLNMITQIGNLTLISLSTPSAYTKIFSTDSIVHENTIFNKCHFGSYLIKPIYNCYIKDIPFYNQVHESYNHAPIVLTEIENRLIKFKKHHKMTFHKWIHKLWKQYD